MFKNNRSTNATEKATDGAQHELLQSVLRGAAQIILGKEEVLRLSLAASWLADTC